MATRRGPQLSNLTYDKACEADSVIRRKAADPIMARGVIAPATGRIDSRTQGRRGRQNHLAAGGVHRFIDDLSSHLCSDVVAKIDLRLAGDLEIVGRPGVPL
jgi:hypothetical protein